MLHIVAVLLILQWIPTIAGPEMHPASANYLTRKVVR